jgi:hypothetical protein
MSVADVVNLIAKEKHSQGGETHNREVTLDLKPTGQSSLKLANKGSRTVGSSSMEFFDRGVAYLSGDKGSAVFQSKGSDSANSWDFTRRAHFSKTGDVLAAADVGADLQPATSVIPAYLASDFAPDSPSGWVGSNCADTAEEVTIDPQSSGHTACDRSHDGGDMDCWDQTKYESSNEQVSVQ